MKKNYLVSFLKCIFIIISFNVRYQICEAAYQNTQSTQLNTHNHQNNKYACGTKEALPCVEKITGIVSFWYWKTIRRKKFQSLYTIHKSFEFHFRDCFRLHCCRKSEPNIFVQMYFRCNRNWFELSRLHLLRNGKIWNWM